MTNPDVSIVMSVFNGASRLPETLDSILSQDGVTLEFIIIDDGSSDESGQILSTYAARDPRIILLSQENKGLTQSLIKGCALARGEFIARQDAGGDISLPGRFARQFHFLRSNEAAALTACGTLFVDDQGEHLYQVSQQGIELQERLRAGSLDRIGGPSHHGAAMFRKSAYQRAGGYRSAFIVAQDLDLWTRMAEIGSCLATPEVFYVARLSRGSISHLQRDQQVESTRAILRCAEARRLGRDETPILHSLQGVGKARRGPLVHRMQDARFYYFLGSVVHKNHPKRANLYFLQALTAWPFHPRACFGLLRSFWRRRYRTRPVTRRHVV